MKLNEKIAASISAAALGTAMWAIPAYAGGPGGGSGEQHQQVWVYVCKYVSTPGQGEVLKKGKQPIKVKASALGWDGHSALLGASFNDEHIRSLVIAIVGDDEEGQLRCPGPTGTPTPTPTPTDTGTSEPSVTPSGSTSPSTEPTESTSPSPSYVAPSGHDFSFPPTSSAEPSSTVSPSYMQPSTQSGSVTPSSSEEPTSETSASASTATEVLSAGPATAVSGTPSYTG